MAALQYFAHIMALQKILLCTKLTALPAALLCCFILFPVGCSYFAPDNPIPKQPRKQAACVTNALGMTFVFIPAGLVHLGTSPYVPGLPDDERPAAIKITRGFFLQTTEVTQGQWVEVMHDNPSFFAECGKDYPVERVAWHECREFITRLNALEGTDCYRLPTEAEWEYACKAGAETDVTRGTPADRDCYQDPYLDTIAWYCGNAGGTTHPVGKKKPNALGLYDMQGNVYEWCQDWYGPYPKEPAIDYTGPAAGETKVMRAAHGFIYPATAVQPIAEAMSLIFEIIILGSALQKPYSAQSK
ncbi:MAG: formylglycine-generating enzyme family protein [Pseudomonadota bacterium]